MDRNIETAHFIIKGVNYGVQQRYSLRILDLHRTEFLYEKKDKTGSDAAEELLKAILGKEEE